MADVASMLAQFAGQTGSTTPVDAQKQAEVAVTGLQKQAQVSGVSPGMPTDDQLYQAAAASANGRDFDQLHPVARDAATMNVLDLYGKYGPSATQLMERYGLARGGYTADRTAGRDTGQALGDSAISAGLGGANGLLSIPDFAAGLVSAKAGAWGAQKIQDLNTLGQNLESPGLQDHRRAYDTLEQLDIGDNTARYDQERAQENEHTRGMAAWTRIGRDVMTGVKNAVDDPEILQDGIANGAGSMLAVGPLTKGISVGAKALGAARLIEAAAGVDNPLVQGAAHFAEHEGATTAAIGAMEGGGAYQQTTADALQKGATPEQANKAGLIAGAIQTPAAMLTGPLVAKFEENPLAMVKPGEAVTNILKEGLEEGLQSGSGQFSQNVGEKSTIAPNQDLSEGVGEQAAQGALYSMGSAGAVEGAVLPVHAIGLAAKTAQKGMEAGVNALAARADAKMASVKAEQTQTATNAQDQAVADAPELKQQLQDVVQGNPELQTRLDGLFNSVKFDPSETSSEAPVVQQAVQGATDRYQALRQVAQAAQNPDLTDAERAQAGAYLVNSYGQHQDTLINGFDKAVGGIDIPDDHKAMPKLQEFMNTVADLGNHPAIKSAVQQAQEAAAKPSIVDQFSDKALSTPEGVQSAQQTANAVVDLAANSPAQADPKVLDIIRAQAVKGQIQLSAEQMKTLIAAHSLVQATQDRLEAQKQLGLSNGDQVSHEAQVQEGVGNPEESPVRSAAAHYKGVMDAYRSGDLDVAHTRLQDMALFSQHMQNKVEALNTNYASGRPDLNTGFQALSPNRELGEAKWYNGKPVFLNAKSERSVKSAQNVATDARAVVQLTNGLSTAFPELGVKHIAPVSLQLDPNLDQKAFDIVKAHQSVSQPVLEEEKTAPEPEVKEKTEVKEPQSEPSQTEQEVATGTQDDPGVTNSSKSPVEGNDQKTSTGPDISAPAATENKPYDRLLGSKEGKNGFVKSFRQPTGEDAKSHLVGLGDQVVKTITDAFTSAKAFIQQHPGELTHKLTPEVLDGYTGFLVDQVPAIQAALDKSLGAFLKSVDLAKAKPENPVQNWVRGRALNLVEEGEDGKLAYHPELVQSSVLAGVQWLLNTVARPNRVLGEDEVADILGVAPTEVSQDTLDLFNRGNMVSQVKQELASTITRFWGVTADPKAPMGFTKGIPEAMAAEMLKAMVEAGVLQFRTENFGQGGDTRTFNWVDLADSEDLHEQLAKMAPFPSAIEQLSVANPVETRFISTPPSNVPEFQMRNRLVRNTDQQKQAIRNEQDTPHFINTHMVSFLETMGRDAVLSLFGAGDIENQKLNKNDRLSLTGQNATIGGAFDALQSMVSELRNKAEAAGVDPEEMPIHYEYNVSRVGRMHMLGLHNPQSSKLMREAILPTRTTLDLTDKKAEAKFLLAIGQAWGEKVHKQGRQDTVDAVKTLASGKFEPALTVLDDFLSGHEMGDEEIQTLKDAFGDNLTPAAVHAAMELARYFQADTAGKKAFKTDLYVEADGVTDGPINALVHISTGTFNPRWVQLVAKGGLFLGSKGMTVNDFVRSGAEQGRDLYQMATDEFTQIMGRFRQSIAHDAGLSGQTNALLTLMNNLLPDLTFDQQDNKLEIARGITKNPLTVTIYGSGEKGIADKVTGALTSAFYQELSKSAQGKSNMGAMLKDQIEQLASRPVFNGKNGLYVIDKSTKAPARASDEDYTLTPEQLQNLQQNVLHLFVGPLRDAIESTISDTQAGRTKLREAVQVQSIFAQHLFRQLVDEELSKLPEDERKLFLSQVQLDAIYKKMGAVNPLIETGTQSFLPSGTDKSDVQASEFSRSLDGQLSSPAWIYGPTDAGVAGIPYMVIGPGDGQMMQSLSTMKNAPQGTLKVFDGVHLRLDQLDQDAQKVNQAVYGAWQGNPLSAVNESFHGFLKAASFEDMPSAQVEALKRALFTKDEAPSVTSEKLEARIRAIGPELDRLTSQSQDRHDALSKVQMSVDHMASAESPYQAEGESLEGLTEDQIADRLNQLMRAPKEVASEAEGDADDPGRPPVPAEVIPSQNFAKLVNQLNLPAEQKNLLREVVKPLMKQGWEIVRGSQDQTSDHARGLGYTPYLGAPGETVKGYTALTQQRIYLNTNEPETLLHELLHAAVTQKILDHYQGNTTSEISETVSNLETLMAEWTGRQNDLSGLSSEQRDVYLNALNQMKAEQNMAGRSEAENQAAALDEFLAWNLSNQDLIKMAQQTKADNPLVRVVKRVLIAMKNLIWGRKNAPMVRSDMYSALRFNASVLINAAPTMQSRAFALTRAMSVVYGQSERIADLHKRLMNVVGTHLREDPTHANFAKKLNNIQSTGINQVTDAVIANGFSMTMQEKSAFKMLMTVLSTTAKLNQASLDKAQTLYTYAVKELSPSSFMSDPTSTNPAHEYVAQQQLAILSGIDHATGKSVTGFDAQGRSTLLPAFMALAMVSDDFRQVLTKLPMPKGEWLENDHLDNVLSNAGNGAMDWLGNTLAGVDRSKTNVQEAMDALTDRLSENTVEQSNFLAQATNPVFQGIEAAGDIINKGNDALVNLKDKGAKAAADALDKLQAKTTNKLARTTLEVGKLAAKLVTETGAKEASEGVLSLLNQVKIWKPLSELINELVGETDATAPLHALIKETKGVLSKLRQEFRENLPKVISDQFTRELTKEEWTHLHQSVGKTDLAVLHDSHTLPELLEMLSRPAKVDAEVKSLEADIHKTAGGQNADLILSKTEQLAHYMVTGEAGPHLLRNAEAVSNLLGVKGRQGTQQAPKDLISSVDRLASLYALGELSPEARNTLSSLAQKEAKGMEFLMSYLIGQRKDEQAKVVTDEARMNHYKGFIPSEAQQGSSLIVADDSEKARLLSLGYKRVADYKGSFADKVVTKAGQKGYYFSPVSGNAPFSQGALQNARQTASGVDPVTGHTYGGAQVAGRITDPLEVKRLTALNMGAKEAEPLMPIFGKDGKVTSYERSIDPNQEGRLNRNTNLAQMIGAWRGRQVEEAMAGKINERVIQTLHDRWQDDQKAGRTNEYVDLFSPANLKGDPVVADAVRLLTPQTRELIRNTFGADGFQVRKDMLNEAIGSRNASVGDLWTGSTRLPPEAVDVARRVAIGIFGLDAYRYLVTAEKGIQDFVKDAKSMIVVRSIIVPVSNTVSNIYQLASLGIGMNRIAKGFPVKLAEVNAYADRRVREIEAEAELRAADAKGDVVASRKLNTELQGIQDANRRLSIWPLVEAGELSSISGGEMEREDIPLYSGKIISYLESKVDKLPPGLRSLARYGIITQDTPLFQGLAKAMEYGDFLAKAVTYDHLLEDKKLSSQEALNEVREEFVNYDRFRGRTRSYAESMGLLWFGNYKIRITKIAFRQLRRNPLHVLLAGLVPSPPLLGSVGTPLNSNLFTITANGHLGYSIGPHMGLQADSMNPWVHMFEGGRR